MVLHRVRGRLPQMGGSLPGLRSMEHDGRGACARHEAEQRLLRPRSAAQRASAGVGDTSQRRRAHPHALGGAQPRARRRPRGRIGGAHRRRAGHRQEHTGATEHPLYQEPAHTLCVGRGKRHADQDARRPHRAHERQLLCGHRDFARKHLPAYRRHRAAAAHRRLHPDHRHRHHRVVGRQREPGARMCRPAAALRQGK